MEIAGVDEKPVAGEGRLSAGVDVLRSQRRAVLVAAAVTQHKLDTTPRQQGQIVVLENVLGIETVLAPRNREQVVPVIDDTEAHVEAEEAVLLHAQAAGLIRVAAGAKGSKVDLIDQAVPVVGSEAQGSVEKPKSIVVIHRRPVHVAVSRDEGGSIPELERVGYPVVAGSMIHLLPLQAKQQTQTQAQTQRRRPPRSGQPIPAVTPVSVRLLPAHLSNRASTFEP